MKARVLALASAATALVALAALPARAALEQGAAAPDFSTKAYLAGKEFNFNLNEALKKGPVVLYFFPAAYTPGCQIEAHLFAEAADEFKAQHATVIGVTAGKTDQLDTVAIGLLAFSDRAAGFTFMIGMSLVGFG
ncbi:MAG: redoxin domain-containing protein, partial [Caulobacteraceae bacterium]